MIVVTGAAGFIGSNIVAELETHGLGPIAAVDRFGTDERWRNLAKRSIACFVRPEALREFLNDNAARVRAIIHMGAIADTTERDVDRLIACNIAYSVMLWDWCAAFEVPLVYASSAAAYGGIEEGFIDDERPAAVQALRPLNPYGWSKKATDLIFMERVAACLPAPPQWVGLRFFNVYGPNEYHKGAMRSVACKLFEQMAAAEPMRLFRSGRAGTADGGQRRDFVYVKDCTAAVLWFLERAEVSGIFNIGTGRAESFLEVAHAIARAMDRPVDVEFFDMPSAIRDRYQYRTQADVSKLRARGFDAPFVSLEDGIADYVGGHLARDDPYR